jgi:hypothetical protein
MFLLIKALISGGVIALASETAKRFPLWGAVMVSVPLTSLLTALWLHAETKDNQKIAIFLENVFWAHLPTLVFFIICPMLLKNGMNFWAAMGISLAATSAVFLIYAMVLKQFGISITE